MKELLKLNRFFWKYKGTVLLGTLFLVSANIFLVWIPILIRQTIDAVEVLTTENKYTGLGLWEILTSAEGGGLLATNTAYLMLAVVLYGVLLYATRQTLIVTSRKIEFDMRNEIFDRIQKLPQSFYSQNKSGDIYVRATEDVQRVREYFGPAFMYTIQTVSRAAIIITIMVLVNPVLTLWALLPLPALTLFAYWVSGFIHKRSNEIQEQYASLAGRASEAFSSIRLIKAYAREDYEKKRFMHESEIYRRRKLRLDVVESLFHPMLSLLIGLSIVLVIWQGGIMVVEGIITVGNIAEFIIHVTYLTWPVASLGYTINLIQRSAASQERIAKMMRTPNEIQDNEETASDIREIKGHISFQNISFRYPKAEALALDRISFTIKPGQTVAFVGRTGSGKTTLVQLIPRLFNPTAGSIQIDGRDISTLPLGVLRKNIGFVPQDTFLFSDTIAENIAFGLENCSIKEIERAADNAQVLENINEFENGFDTMLGERGITLSGGQKQRTSIARAIIRKPSILILDDSLSAVDTKTEDAILTHLKSEFKSKTTVLISHRISTVKDADCIFVLKDGKITESGKHEELIAKQGYYATMYKKQLLEQELAQL
ncbi:MAG: ABC transporter ATP-binding protein/permease [Candidatus Cyclonatronum sp.]|uniref:ABC transporter ATP-binding protein n=1 Tax=Cyclonatronum sp. TaxID=3024185 RepID=UPI0025C27B10|nr:ABC transporter ATP-binding protein [Cyclonatronum sp.]MCC5933152.1 ABC transporter ATP-binding protein [Balneolales bacterium]MCH8485540.1 ABC transporter ATP-binding protein/permease [Cyclonatronum sp.]